MLTQAERKKIRNDIQADLKKIRNDIDVALEAVAKANGLHVLKTGGATFNANGFVIKVEGIVEGGLSRDAQRYNHLRVFHPGLPVLGTVFKAGRNQEFTITGANTKGTKILATQAKDEGTFLFSLDSIIHYTKTK